MPDKSSCSGLENQKSVFNYQSKVTAKASSSERHQGAYSTDSINYLHKTRTIASDNPVLQNGHQTLLLPGSYFLYVLIKSGSV